MLKPLLGLLIPLICNGATTISSYSTCNGVVLDPANIFQSTVDAGCNPYLSFGGAGGTATIQPDLVSMEMMQSVVAYGGAFGAYATATAEFMFIGDRPGAHVIYYELSEFFSWTGLVDKSLYINRRPVRIPDTGDEWLTQYDVGPVALRVRSGDIITATVSIGGAIPDGKTISTNPNFINLRLYDDNPATSFVDIPAQDEALIPTPEPGSYALALGGLGLVGLFHRRLASRSAQ